MYALARDFPDLHFSLNGGVELCRTAQAAIEHAPPSAGRIQGVMIGRGAYNMPWPSLATADHTVFGDPPDSAPTRRQVERVCHAWLCLAVLQYEGPACVPQVKRQLLLKLAASFVFHGVRLHI